jgi:hypothetical protein
MPGGIQLITDNQRIRLSLRPDDQREAHDSPSSRCNTSRQGWPRPGS